MLKRIVLICGGGRAKVVAEAINKSGEFNIYGIVERDLKKGGGVLGIPIVGDDDALTEIFKKGVKYAFICIGSIGNCDTRKRLYKRAKGIGFKLPAIVHPAAVIAEGVELGEGTFVASGAVINPGVKVGKETIINTSSSVDHDCEIGDFVQIAPGATLCGGVTIGDETHVGAGACVIQYVNIGRKCMIAAGAVITRDITNGVKSYGRSAGDLNLNGREPKALKNEI